MLKTLNKLFEIALSVKGIELIIELIIDNKIDNQYQLIQQPEWITLLWLLNSSDKERQKNTKTKI